MKLKHALMFAASAVLSAVALFGCKCGDDSCTDGAPAKSAAKKTGGTKKAAKPEDGAEGRA